MGDLGAWAPAITAALTLLNTALLVWTGRNAKKAHKEANGARLQLLAEAEQRGRRSERHRRGRELIGE